MAKRAIVFRPARGTDRRAALSEMQKEETVSQEMVKRDDGANQIERVLIGGDISQLKAEERISYYKMVCDSVGLNPLTKPFEYLTLNGKLMLYARKDCTDQLRSIHKISIQIVARETVNDCYVVTARATKPDGRTDESIGAVSISNAKGDALCNAIMKAETKAKRRVTLSMCGLGMLDETEIETIPARNKKELALVEQEVVLGDGGKMKAMQDAGIVPPAITEMLKQELVKIGQPADASHGNRHGGAGDDTGISPKAGGVSLPPVPESDYISSDDAKSIHIHARSFLDKKYQKLAKDMVHAWCKARGLVDEQGEGTLLKIKKLYVDADGAQMSGITRARQSLEIYMKERNAEKIAEETQAV